MDRLDWMFGDAFQHLAQIIFGIEGIQLRRLGQRVDRSCTLTTLVGKGLIMPWFRQRKLSSDIRFIL